MPAPEPTREELLRLLAPEVAGWFAERHDAFTPAQALALPVVARGEHLLLASPTGSGKTLAAFLGVLSDLHARARRGTLSDGIHCVYVSPLKALAHDVARNLEAPLAQIAARLPDPPDVRVAIRTGDTPRAERDRMARRPPHVLVTTPESAALVLASKRLRMHLAPLRWLVVDEVHALAGTKRGAHLALTLERLARHAVQPPRRVGLSATVAPLDEVARWLTGGEACAVREAPPKSPPEIDVALAPGEDAVLEVCARALARSRTTLVFAPTRAAVERLTRLLQGRLGESLVEEGEEVDEEASVDPAFPAPERAPRVAPHHGSMSRDARVVVEERLKRQEVRCVVTSSSLELGVHLDGVEEVVLVGSPKGVARAVQRLGRSGHHLEGVSRGTLVATDVDDLAEALALRRLARARRVEEIAVPRAPFDVLAQHLAGLAAEGPVPVEEAFALARRAWPWRDLARAAFDDALALLEDGADLARVEGGVLRAAGPRTLLAVATQGGVIPEAGLVKAYHEGRYVGELDEAFVAQLSPGDSFALSGETWRFLGAQGLHARVGPARGDHPTVPAWRAEGLSASDLLAEAAGALRRPDPPTTGQDQASNEEDETESQWRRFRARQAAFSALPEGLAVETVVEDGGQRAAVFHLAAGRRANEALARALALRVGDALDATARAVAGDHGFAILAPRAWKPTRASLRRLFERPLDADLRRAVQQGELLKRRFRHVAFRALLLRNDRIPPGERQRAANQLLARLLRDDPAHPLLAEAWREALEDALDAPAAERLRARVASGDLPLATLPQRPHASPMGARILVRAHDAVAGGDREARLRDMDERVEEWLEKQDADAASAAARQGARKDG